jgi:UDP-glucose:glycoprotein glucosyltransferase
LDLKKKEDLSRLVEEIAIMIKRAIPIRFGVVVSSNEGDVDGTVLARIFYHLVNTYGRAIAMKFGEDLLESYDPTTLSTKMKSLYSNIYSKSTPIAGHEKIPYDELVTSTELIENIRNWTRRLGVNPKDGAIFGNGQVFPKDDSWLNKLVTALHEDIQLLQRVVFSADVSDEDDILEYLLRDVPKSRNEYIFPAQSGDIRFINLPEALSGEIVYVHGETKEESGVENATVIWVVDDFDSINGIELVKSAAIFQAAHPEVTIGLVHNPGSTTGPPNLSLLIYHLAKNGLLDNSGGSEKFRRVIQEVDFASHDSGDADEILGIKALSWRTVDSEEARKFWDASHSFVQSAGFVEGQKGLIINGRVEPSSDYTDRRSLVRFEKVTVSEWMTLNLYRNTSQRKELSLQLMRLMKWDYSPKSRRSIRVFGADNRNYALLAAKLTSIASVSSTSDVPPGIFDTPVYSRRRSYELLDPKVGVLEYGSMEDAVFQIAITLDPLSETAQKWSSIIQVRSN